MKKYKLLLLSLLSGFIFTLGWPAQGLPVFLFFAFIPLLFIEDYISRNKEKFNLISVFLYTYPGFFVWNLLTTWWIWNSTTFGAVVAVVCNSLFMALVFQFYHFTKKTLQHRFHGYWALLFYWMSFEYLHLDWDLSWSWLNLGNGFGGYTEWVQWYEITGAFGGTLWILLLNILLFEWLKNLRLGNKKLIRNLSVSTALLMLLPVLLSYARYYTYEEKINPVDVVVVQQNIDPYNEQYELPPPVIVKRLIDVAKTKLDSAVDFMVCPESALQEYLWEDQLDRSLSLDSLYLLIDRYPKLRIVLGISTRKIYHTESEISATARKTKGDDFWYDVFNTAMYVDAGHKPQFYHKSKLVPGVEMMPFPKLLKPLEKFAVDLGGMTGSHGKDKERKVFIPTKGGVPLGACICYESIYGDFLTGFARKGAQLLFVITNDGWWGDTPGYKQHFLFSKLRAVESRRSIARAANTGKSAFFNQRGDVFQPTAWWQPACIRQSLNANSEITFYVEYGDYIGRISLLFGSLLMLMSVILKILKRRKKLK